MLEISPTQAAPGPFQLYVATLFKALGDRDPVESMSATPAALRKAVAGLTPAQMSQPEAPAKWSVRQVVQHLADSELVGGFRFRMVLAHDGPSLPGYDQDAWAAGLRYEASDWEAALEDFARLRAANLRLIGQASAADLARYMVHSERGNETLGYMIRMYGGHDLVHLAQIARIRGAVGASRS